MYCLYIVYHSGMTLELKGGNQMKSIIIASLAGLVALAWVFSSLAETERNVETAYISMHP